MIFHRTKTRKAALACFSAGLLWAATGTVAAHADDFFKGKTITINIGSSAGGGLDVYGRLVARYFGRHIPGNPNIVASNLPGAGGKVVAGRLFNVAARDGTQIGIVFPGILVEPLLLETVRKEYDPTKFNYIGNAHAEVLVCFIRNDTPAKTPADLTAHELIIGATAPGSTTWDYPAVTNNVLHTKFKIVTGYKGSREVTLAVEKNEAQGICGVGFSTVKIQYPDAVKGNGFARIFAQEDMKGHPDLNKAGVPLMLDLVKNDADRNAMRMLYAQSSFARPLILPQDVPADRVAILRKAFNETMKDPELLAEAAKMNIDVLPSTGEEVQMHVAEMYRTPPEVVARVRAALGRK